MPNSKPTLIKPTRHEDERGFFSETYSRSKYKKLGIDFDFLQDNSSLSWKAGTLRGLHFQAPPFAQGKLVRCGNGAIFDVAVDIRKGSPTFGKWEGYELSAENGYQFFVPIGFAHGFVTLKADSEIIYKCTDYYTPKSEGTIRWDDPSIGIKWPLSENPIINKRDATAPLLSEVETPFRYGDNS